MNLIPKKRLDGLLQILPSREMPEKTKEAAKLVIESGFTYDLAALKTGVSSKRISLAVRKLSRMDAILLEAYRL
ncbi:hypothetical protein [Vibrio sp. HN007]|uniref:hypothetical protein n=1 Tax=Vibrio iocasae TaxID=3098914 RepID=UPI0035D43AB8